MQKIVALGLSGRKAVVVAAGIAVLVAPAIAAIADAPPLQAQQQGVGPSTAAPEFAVASIKLNTQTTTPLNVISLMFLRTGASSARDGRFSMQGIGAIPVHVLIQVAHSVKEFQIRGGPSWVSSDRYDVDARAEGPATFDQMRLMLQSLLADRFRLVLSRETRPLPVYELVAARDGLKIAAMKEGSCVTPDRAKPFGALICGGVRRQIVSVAPERRDVIEAAGVSMPTLIESLSDEVGRTVIDKTGFTEQFDFRLEFASSLAAGLLNPDAAAPSSSGLSIFTALEEQLGMRLRSTTGPVEVLVIDRVERPSAN